MTAVNWCAEAGVRAKQSMHSGAAAKCARRGSAGELVSGGRLAYIKVYLSLSETNLCHHRPGHNWS